MSKDLIRRSDAIKALDANFTIKGKENMQTVLNYLELVRTRIENAPTIEPKRGEWIEDYNNTYGQCRMKCSVCGKFSGIGGIKSNQRKPFCPNCGASMREREGE